MPLHDKPDLAALVGSRICHDLISPIGAIGNGVELMMMEGAAKGPEMALITESVAPMPTPASGFFAWPLAQPAPISAWAAMKSPRSCRI